jgi:hypothetical protein
MKVILFVLASALLTTSVFAQDETKGKKTLFPQKNELGLMAETGFGNNNKNTGFTGLQYKRWVKPYMGYRIIASYGEYYERYRLLSETRLGDTVIETSRATTVPLASLGAGIEMQRKFYKRVYLFAAVELRGSYGHGRYNHIVSQRVENNAVNYYAETAFSPQADVRMFSLFATPSIGAKLQWRKLIIGTEISAIQLGYTNTKYQYDMSNTGGMLDFNAGSFRQRFFVHYCF